MKPRSASKSSSPGKKSLELHGIPAYFLLFCIGVSLYFLFQILAPFSFALLFAAVLAVAFHPLYRFFLRTFRGRRGVSSLMTCFIVVVSIVIPFLLLLAILASESISVYTFFDAKVRSGALDHYLRWESGSFFYDLKSRFFSNLDLESLDLRNQIIAVAQSLSAQIVSFVQHFLGGIASLFLDFLILLVALYYFLKDGETLLAKVINLSPLPDRYESALLKKLGEMTNAVLYGSFLTSVVQGIMGGLGFFFAGIEQAFLWGTVMALFSLLPYVGTAIVWLPASIFLFVTGHLWGALFLCLWGLFVVSLSDNFLRPYFIGEKTATYPLLTFLSIFGGIIVFGLSGALFGPIIVTFTIAFLQMYELEYRDVLKRLNHHL